MKMFQKVTASLLSVLLVGLSFSACSGSTQASSTAAQSTDNSAAASGSKEVDLVISTFNNPFFVKVKEGAEYEAKQKGFNLVVQNANNDNSTELNLAQTDILKKPAALVLDPVDSKAIVSAINKANAANIPVYAFDRKPDGGKLLTFIGYDAIQAGKNAADTIAKGLNEKGKIVEIQGTMGTNVAQDRSKGFEQEIAKYSNIQVVAKQPANFDRSQALNVMTNVLQAHPDINGVYAANDEMAMGVLSALKSKNLNKKVILVGNDGNTDNLNAIESGDIYATNAESPFNEGIQVSDIAAAIIGGQSVPSAKTLEGQIVTKSNLTDYRNYLKKIGDYS